jgi:serine/threonine protein kinase
LPGHFTATQKEARIYDILTKFPGWRNHILPIRSVKTAEDTVVIDFDWLEGEDTSSYLDKHPSEFLQIMRQILMQLRWLALHDYAHGDIKLDNFYRDSEGRILLFDFGRTRKIMYTGIAAELAAIARIIRPYNEALGSWILTTAIDEYDASKPPKDNLAEFYLTIVSKLTPSRTSRKSSSNTRRRSSNSKNGGGRKSRKSSSGSRPH